MENYDLEQVKTEMLIPYALNSRTHSDEQVTQIAASIREFGFTNPVLIDEKKNLIAGHGRLMAAKKLGLDEVPAIVVTGLSNERRRALIIADNKISLNAGWDMEALTAELKDLAPEFGDLIGFSEDELVKLLKPDVVDGLTDQDALPHIPDEPQSVLGDVWTLENHKLVCGDATDTGAYEAMLDGPADLIFTDPPYGMSYGGGRAAGATKKGAKAKAHGMIINDDLTGDNLISLVRDSLATALTHCKPDVPLYACFTWRTYAQFEAALVELGRAVKACIVWDKKSIGLGNQEYRPQHEFIFYCAGKWFGGRAESDVWTMRREAVQNYVHPTQKPVELIERALENSSKPGDLVIDCFGGSGSTLIAAERLGRHSRLVELDPKYCDVMVRRWMDYTGKTAVNQNGEAFKIVD